MLLEERTRMTSHQETSPLEGPFLVDITKLTVGSVDDAETEVYGPSVIYTINDLGIFLHKMTITPDTKLLVRLAGSRLYLFLQYVC